MDPEANITMQRELTARLLHMDASDPSLAAVGIRLAELAEALDEWLSRGGRLPRDWRR